MFNIVYNIGYYCNIYRLTKLKDSSKIENFKNQVKPCLCKKNTMVMQSFFLRFLPRNGSRFISILYCGRISFLSSLLWLKTSQIFRHMANIFAFGDVASGQRQRWICNIRPTYNPRGGSYYCIPKHAATDRH